jgi:type II secretory pathway pseudopilin PulG
LRIDFTKKIQYNINGYNLKGEYNILKKVGFTLAEILITLGLIGTVSAIVLPTLAYNYRAKVLQEQFRSTYSDIRQVGAMINYDKGDVGAYANKENFDTWQKYFISQFNGGGKLMSNAGVYNILYQLQSYYKTAGGSAGPYFFNLSSAGKLQLLSGNNYLCDNGQMWIDSKGRIWTFNSENRLICVDINGVGNPNRYNIDIFSFAPMSAEMVATWVYNDPDNPNDYSGAIIPCDIEQQHRHGLGNSIPSKANNTFRKGGGSALDYCPFWGPVENVAPTNSYVAGKSAKNKTVTVNDSYWTKYIDYK